MQARVWFLCRDGAVIPKWQHAFRREPNAEGEFIFHRTGSAIWEDHRRQTTIAQLKQGTREDVLQLIDAAIVEFKDNRLRVSGLDFDVISKKYQLQSWHVEFMLNESSGK